MLSWYQQGAVVVETGLNEARSGMLAARRLAKRIPRIQELLEGLRVELEAYADEIEEILPENVSFSDRKLSAELILSAVVATSGLTLKELTSSARTNEVLRWRWVAIYIIRQELKMSYMRIGGLFDKDHSTIMSNYRRAQALIVESQDFRDALADVTDSLELYK